MSERRPFSLIRERFVNNVDSKFPNFQDNTQVSRSISSSEAINTSATTQNRNHTEWCKNSNNDNKIKAVHEKPRTAVSIVSIENRNHVAQYENLRKDSKTVVSHKKIGEIYETKDLYNERLTFPTKQQISEVAINTAGIQNQTHTELYENLVNYRKADSVIEESGNIYESIDIFQFAENSRQVENVSRSTKSFQELVKEKADAILARSSSATSSKLQIQKSEDISTSFTVSRKTAATTLHNEFTAPKTKPIKPIKPTKPVKPTKPSPRPNISQMQVSAEDKRPSVSNLRINFEQMLPNQQIGFEPSRTKVTELTNHNRGLPVQKQSREQTSWINDAALDARNFNLPHLAQNCYKDDIKFESISEFDDVLENLTDERIYANFDAKNRSFSHESPRLNRYKRFSYAEKQVHTNLKSSMSLRCLNISKNSNQNPKNDDLVTRKLDEWETRFQNIIDELITTEQIYVENLQRGISNYEQMLSRRDASSNFRDKKLHLLGNIEEILRIHKNKLLPILQENQSNLQRLFKEFIGFIDGGHFYNYVIYTITKPRSEEIYYNFKPYILFVEGQLGDGLGIQSFLLQPIQRLPRYELLIKSLIKEIFDASIDGLDYKHEIMTCNSLLVKIHKLLETINEAADISKINIWSELHLCNMDNKFCKTFKLYVYEHDNRDSYETKVFVFEQFIIYTEIRRNAFIYRGCYDAKYKIDLISNGDSFSMAYLNKQVCTFHASPSYIEECVRFIATIIASYQRRSTKVEDILRTSNRSDSGLGNVWD